MTVVAEGAAIHASTIINRNRKGAELSSVHTDSVQLELYYDPVSSESTFPVSGKVTDPPSFAGEVRLLSAAEDWESGWVPLEGGSFIVELTLGNAERTEYRIEARSTLGTVMTCDPPGLAIRRGLRPAAPPLPYDYGVALRDGTTALLLKKGTPLPTEATVVELKAAGTVNAGSQDELVIFVVEGNSRLTLDNVKVGEIVVKGTDFHRSLKENQPVEVRMSCDESRLLKARVFLPLQDKEYSVSIHPFEEMPDVDNLRQLLTATKREVSRIEAHVRPEEENDVLQTVAVLDQLDATFERAEKGEQGEALRIRKQLSDVRGRLRPLVEKHGIEALHARTIANLNLAKEYAERFKDSMDVAKLEDLRKEADRGLRAKDEKALGDTRERVLEIYWEQYGKTPECWQGQIVMLRERAPLASDPYAFHDFLKRSECCLADDDIEGASLNVIEAWRFVPSPDYIDNPYVLAGVKK